MIGRHGADGGLPAHLLQLFERLVVHRRGRGGGILRIEREEHDALAAGSLKRLDARRDRGVAIAHAPVDHDIGQVLQPFRHQLPLRAGIGAQIAFVEFLVPDGLIGLADLCRAAVEHDAVKDRIPEEPRPLDDTAVCEEFLQIAAHGGLVGAVGRAKVDEENADLSEADFRVVGRQGARHHGLSLPRSNTLTPI